MSATSLTCPLEVIGIVRTGRTSTESTPLQAALNRAESGVVTLFEPYAEGRPADLGLLAGRGLAADVGPVREA